jgi:hypothetical protein
MMVDRTGRRSSSSWLLLSRSTHGIVAFCQTTKHSRVSAASCRSGFQEACSHECARESAASMFSTVSTIFNSPPS